MSKPNNRIDAMFARKREAGERAMIFYLTAGYPDAATTETAIEALDEAGADLIELGIPFSDPIADGPTIQKASQEALEGGMCVRGVFEICERVRRKSEIPLLLFTAANPVYRFGPERFLEECARRGVDGLLIPDMPPEEAGDLIPLCRERGIALIFLAAPTTGLERFRTIARHSTGFIYYISLKGVTGARASVAEDVADKLREYKTETDLPLAVGFGVSRPEHVRMIGGLADGVVVGSALVSLIGEHAGSDRLPEEVRRFARELIEALPKNKASAPAV